MFENIIGQKETVRTLREELGAGAFPRATLFFGPPYAGKLSTALEVARVLSCRGEAGAWTCECDSCRMQKELAHPHTLLLGSRNSSIEIAACADVLLRTRKPAVQYLFVRAVRKLTRRFDTSVWDAEESRARETYDKIAGIEELLAEVLPPKAPPPQRELGDLLEQVAAACAELAVLERGEVITVGQVRKLSSWAHLTASGAHKIAILENADRMQDSARNAMLKLLEEPPEGVHLILLSARRSAIIPTIVSRLRPYAFAERSPDEEEEVLVKIFRQEPRTGSSLRAFFLSWKEINPEALSALARRFMERIMESAVPSVDILAELGDLFGNRKSQKETIVSFLEELTFGFREALRQRRVEVDVLETWGRAVRESLVKMELYNINPQTIVESLYHRMREAVRGNVA